VTPDEAAMWAVRVSRDRDAWGVVYEVLLDFDCERFEVSEERVTRFVKSCLRRRRASRWRGRRRDVLVGAQRLIGMAEAVSDDRSPARRLIDRDEIRRAAARASPGLLERLQTLAMTDASHAQLARMRREPEGTVKSRLSRHRRRAMREMAA